MKHIVCARERVVVPERGCVCAFVCVGQAHISGQGFWSRRMSLRAIRECRHGDPPGLKTMGVFYILLGNISE